MASVADCRFVRPSALRFSAVTVLGLLSIGLGTAQAPLRAQMADAALMAAHHPEAQDVRAWGANWQLAARFAPYKARSLTHATSVSPQWVGKTDRFWYQWENSDGTFYYIVDPARATKRQIFDNDRIPAELTRITGDPFDGQHLPIRNIEFIDENTLQFEVESTLEEEIVDEAAETGDQQQEQEQQQGARRSKTGPKVFHFEYNVSTQTLRELEDWEEPRAHPGWAGVSPDSSRVVFSRECNLFVMGWDDYMRIVDARHEKTGEAADSAEANVEVAETQLTTDGEKNYCYGSSGRG